MFPSTWSCWSSLAHDEVETLLFSSQRTIYLTDLANNLNSPRTRIRRYLCLFIFIYTPNSYLNCTEFCAQMLLHQFMNGTLETMYPSIQKDTTFTKIFVGGLPYHTTDASLRKYFETFGDIDEAVVITDRQTGKSRGYGFVSKNNNKPFSYFNNDMP